MIHKVSHFRVLSFLAGFYFSFYFAFLAKCWKDETSEELMRIYGYTRIFTRFLSSFVASVCASFSQSRVLLL